jgi:hypothetical protein
MWWCDEVSPPHHLRLAPDISFFSGDGGGGATSPFSSPVPDVLSHVVRFFLDRRSWLCLCQIGGDFGFE